jgi:hypothetical protein
MHQLIFTIQDQITEQEKGKNKIGGDLQLLSGGNRVIGLILPTSVLNAFRRENLVSSSQQFNPHSNGGKASRKINRLYKKLRIANKRDPKREIRWVDSTEKFAYRSISCTERPVI